MRNYVLSLIQCWIDCKLYAYGPTATSDCEAEGAVYGDHCEAHGSDRSATNGLNGSLIARAVSSYSESALWKCSRNPEKRAVR